MVRLCLMLVLIGGLSCQTAVQSSGVSAHPDGGSAERFVRFRCLEGFFEGRISPLGGTLTISNLFTDPSVHELSRIERANETRFRFAKYRLLTPGAEAGHFSIAKKLFTGAFEPTTDAYFNRTGEGQDRRLQNCRTQGTPVPEMIGDEQVMGTLAAEFRSSFYPRVQRTAWHSLLSERSVSSLPQTLRDAFGGHIDPNSYVWEFALEVARGGTILGYVVMPESCNPEECEEGGAIYFDATGALVASHLD